MRARERSYGRKIGMHLGKPIFESFKDSNGTYVFDRIAECDVDGCPLDQLGKDELLVEPGLIYRRQVQ